MWLSLRERERERQRERERGTGRERERDGVVEKMCAAAVLERIMLSL